MSAPFRVWPWPVLALGLLLAVLPRPALAGICQCRLTEGGICERWHQPVVHYTIYAPPALDPSATTAAPGTTDLDNDVLRAEVEAAFASWQAVQCDTCLSDQGAACGPVPCAPNPLGIQFQFEGFADQPTLATQCLVPDAPQPCQSSAGVRGAAPDTVQVAFLRNEADWPVQQSPHVTQTLLTVGHKSGKILDADILLRASKDRFCVDACHDGQYPLRAVLLREIGHLLGLGESQDAEAVLAADFQPGEHVSTDLPAADTACACQIYRSSADLAECRTPTEDHGATEGGCRAAPAGRVWPLGLLGLGWLIYRKARNSPVPNRRA